MTIMLLMMFTMRLFMVMFETEDDVDVDDIADVELMMLMMEDEEGGMLLEMPMPKKRR